MADPSLLVPIELDGNKLYLNVITYIPAKDVAITSRSDEPPDETEFEYELYHDAEAQERSAIFEHARYYERVLYQWKDILASLDDSYL